MEIKVGKKYLIFLILFISLIVNSVVYWKIFGQSAVSKNIDQGDKRGKDIQLISTALKNIEGRELCTLKTEETKVEEEPVILKNEESYSVQVLNGSGVVGAAKTVKDELEQNKQIGEITLGNADETKETVLKFKKNVPSGIRTIILEILVKKYPEAKEEQDEKIDKDIVIILGRPQ